MKKIIYILLFGFFIFIFQGTTLLADDFSDCLDLERLKAKSDGATAKESIDQAEKICKLKFNRDSNTDKEKKKKETKAETTGSASVVDKPNFSVDLMFGNKKVNIIDELCKENGADVFLEGKCDKHPASALLLDFFLTSNISLAFGYLNSTYQYQYQFSDIDYSYTTSEVSLGGRLHLKKGRDKKGLDLFVGAGSVTIERCHNYEKQYSGEGRVKIKDCAEKEAGGYSEGGIKYVTRAGFSVGCYLRASSPEKYGGNTSGVTLGWTW